MFYFIEDAIQYAAYSDLGTENTRELLKGMWKQYDRKGLALTERQHALACAKLDEIGFLPHPASELSLTHPYRVIDRSRYIKKTTHKGETVLKIRFVWNKAFIQFQNELKPWLFDKNKKNNEYYYMYSDRVIYAAIMCLSQFEDFDIEPELVDRFEQMVEIADNPQDYIPGIYNYKIKYLPKEAIQKAHSKYGPPSKENLLKYFDRRLNLGLVHFDEVPLFQTKALHKIINRKSIAVSLCRTVYSIEDIVEALKILERTEVKFISGVSYLKSEIQQEASLIEQFKKYGITESNDSDTAIELNTPMNMHDHSEFKQQRVNEKTDLVIEYSTHPVHKKYEKL